MTSRHSNSDDFDGPLITDPQQLAEIEARNALLQFDAVYQLVAERKNTLLLTPKDICGLQKLAVRDVWQEAGHYRVGAVTITNSDHQPPPPNEVAGLVEEMCHTANQRSNESVWTSSYLMWRLNWIHPFVDGNGRTSRAIGYLALCLGLKAWLPGTQTVPELIAADKASYYAALDAADAAWASSQQIDVTEMQKLVVGLLARQLQSASQ